MHRRYKLSRSKILKILFIRTRVLNPKEMSTEKSSNLVESINFFIQVFIALVLLLMNDLRSQYLKIEVLKPSVNVIYHLLYN
jgi:hypothetical protein